MADWNDIKNAFERESKKAENESVDKEQKLLKSITIYLCSKKGVSPIQGYDPEEAVEFLDKPAAEIKSCLGEEWKDISEEDLGLLVYSLSKKVKKAGNVIHGKPER